MKLTDRQTVAFLRIAISTIALCMAGLAVMAVFDSELGKAVLFVGLGFLLCGACRIGPK